MNVAEQNSVQLRSVAKNMTPEQIAKAQALAKEMVKKNPKLLKK